MSFTFNGTTQYISAASFPGSTGDVTKSIAFFFQTTMPGTRQFIYSEGDESAGWTRFAVEIENVVKFNARSAAYDTTTAIVANTWYHVAVVYSGGTALVYINGVLEKTQGGLALPTAGSGFNLGRFYGASLYLSGKMA